MALVVTPRYEVRECGRCFDGRVHEAGDPTVVRTVPCPTCRGTDKVSVYLYPKRKRRRS